MSRAPQLVRLSYSHESQRTLGWMLWAFLASEHLFSPPQSASQGAEQPQMLSPDWSWKFEGQLNLLMFVL